MNNLDVIETRKLQEAKEKLGGFDRQVIEAIENGYWNKKVYTNRKGENTIYVNNKPYYPSDRLAEFLKTFNID